MPTSLFKWLTYLGCILALPAAAYASGFSDDPDFVRVHVAGSDSVHAVPGGIVTAAFVVSNTSTSEKRVTADVEVPEGWKLISAPVEASAISPGRSRTILVSIKVPARAAVSSYPVAISVHDADNRRDADRTDLNVFVQRQDKLSVTILDMPPFVLAGETFEVNLLVFNGGNAPVSVANSVSTIPFVRATVIPPVADIPAGEEGAVRIVINSGSRQMQPRRQLIEFTATPAAGEPVSRMVWTDIVPRVRHETATARIPGRVRVTGLSSDRGQGIQMEGAVRGSIVEGTDHLIDVLVRTPDLAATSLFGRRDEYRVAYLSDGFTLRLGDHPFGLSPLTERGRLGRGIGVELGSGKVSTNLFASRNRIIFPRENQLGARVTFELNRYADFSANFLRKYGTTAGQSISVRTEIFPLENTSLDFELGDGTRSGVRSSGMAAELRTATEWYNFSGRYVKTGPQFPGYYSGYDNLSTSIILTPSRSIRLETIYQQQDRQFETALSTSPVHSRSKYLQAGPVVETRFLGMTANFGGSYQHRETATVSSLVDVDQSERLLSLRSGLKVGQFNVTTQVERGRVRSASQNQQLPARRYELGFGGNIGVWTYSVGAERLNGASLYRLQNRSVTVVKFNSDIRIGSSTAFNVNAFSIHDPEYSVGQYSFVQADLEHRFSFGHMVSFSSGFSAVDSWLQHPRTDFSVSYEIPLSLPQIGSNRLRISGRILDAESGEGIARVRVKLGDRVAVTDDTGSYTITRPPTGLYYLIIDQASIGMDRTTLVPNPVPVHLEPETQSMPTIHVARSGRIHGSVLRVADDSRTQQPVVGAVVEIADAGGRSRIITEGDGTFEFNKLRPGEWTLTVVHGRIPSGYSAEHDTYSVDLSPGGDEAVEVVYRKDNRKIKFVASGRIGVGSPTDSVRVDPKDQDAADAPEEILPVGPVECVPLLSGMSYTVVTEDNLLTVLEKNYCTALVWSEVWLRNRAALSVSQSGEGGLRLRLPQMPTPIVDGSVADSSRIHVVKPGETLSGMAGLYYGTVGSWPRIWIVNQESIVDPDIIYPGMELTVPAPGQLHPGEIRFLKRPLLTKD